MKLEIYNGDYVGTAEWQGPGRVALTMTDERDRDWFEDYFAAEDSYLTGPVECAEMSSERRDSSEQAFERAAFWLAAYAYTVKSSDDFGTLTTARGEAASGQSVESSRHGAHTRGDT